MKIRYCRNNQTIQIKSLLIIRKNNSNLGKDNLLKVEQMLIRLILDKDNRIKVRINKGRVLCKGNKDSKNR